MRRQDTYYALLISSLLQLKTRIKFCVFGEQWSNSKIIKDNFAIFDYSHIEYWSFTIFYKYFWDVLITPRKFILRIDNTVFSLQFSRFKGDIPGSPKLLTRNEHTRDLRASSCSAVRDTPITWQPRLISSSLMPRPIPGKNIRVSERCSFYENGTEEAKRILVQRSFHGPESWE